MTTTKKMTQKELRRQLSMVLSRNEYDRERFHRTVEEYLSEHKYLGDVSDKCVKWTTPGVWTRFLDNCFAEYKQWREIFTKKGSQS